MPSSYDVSPPLSTEDGDLEHKVLARDDHAPRVPAAVGESPGIKLTCLNAAVVPPGPPRARLNPGMPTPAAGMAVPVAGASLGCLGVGCAGSGCAGSGLG